MQLHFCEACNCMKCVPKAVTKIRRSIITIVKSHTVESLYCGHLGDQIKCSVERDVLISRENFLAYLESVLKVSLFHGCPLRGVPLYTCRTHT